MSRLFQVQFIVDRKNKDKIFSGRAYRDECFKHDFMRKAELICGVLRISKFIAFLGIGVIGNFHTV